MKTYNERLEAAFNYWISKGASLSAARELAHEQIQFEDEQNEPQFLGSNDSLPLITY